MNGDTRLALTSEGFRRIAHLAKNAHLLFRYLGKALLNLRLYSVALGARQLRSRFAHAEIPIGRKFQVFI
ncbi:hypothetical protein PoB_002000000 [Plakobranchus ocellatus]|uniref:Uncharacterized protein n=1 Tax=Plakobranchus ocellatus TaxID=259542 RepID=A0AAV3ZEC2_9GAST|nr:hypothetical protein PoB_002000000 [Plakobranchus ocellatus]